MLTPKGQTLQVWKPKQAKEVCSMGVFRNKLSIATAAPDRLVLSRTADYIQLLLLAGV